MQFNAAVLITYLCFPIHRTKSEKAQDKRRKGFSVNEKMLFYGTSENDVIASIYKTNLDFRFYEFGNYGRGIYFARDAKYCNDYTIDSSKIIPPPDTMRHMFYCRVIVGDYVKGSKNMKRPPYRNEKDPDWGVFDSLVDSMMQPTIFAISEDYRYYPEYLIQYNFGKVVYRFSKCN